MYSYKLLVYIFDTKIIARKWTHLIVEHCIFVQHENSSFQLIIYPVVVISTV